MSYVRQSDGYYHIPIVELGKRLRDNFGLTIVEHPAFGGVSRVHSPNSYHYTPSGNALDVQDWRDDVIGGVHWKQRTKNLRDLLRGSGAEILGPGYPGHDTHVHLATKDGVFRLNDSQFNYLFSGNSGGKNSTFAYLDTPTGGQRVSVEPAVLTDDEGTEASPEIIKALERTKTYADMSKSEMNAEYDRLRAESPETAAEEGLKMHKAFFKDTLYK